MAKKASTGADVAGGGLPLSAKCRMVMLIGKDLYVRSESTRVLREALIKEHGEVDTVVFDGATATAAEILDESRSFGLIATHKLILVDDAERVVKEDTRPLFERYAEAPSESATLVFRSEKLIPGKLGDAVQKVGTVIRCEPPTPQEAVRWVLAECRKRHAIDIDQEAAGLLVELVGPVQAQLDTEMAKLAVAACEATTITRDLVAQFVGRTRDEELWAIQSTVIKAPLAGRIDAIRYAVHTLRQPPVMLLWALTDLSRKLHVMSRGAKSGGNPFAIKKAAKVWGPAGDELYEIASKMDWTRAVGLFRSCVEADRRSKSGLGDAVRSSEIAALRFPRAGGGQSPPRGGR
jgi:hypothetical protein